MRIRIWVATALITSGLWATWLAPANASIEALFAPSKDLWPRWTTHDERSRQVVDHSAFDRLLGRYLSLEPFREVWIQGDTIVSRLSMKRIMARPMKAAVVRGGSVGLKLSDAASAAPGQDLQLPQGPRG